MKDPFKSRKIKSPDEINWKIREIFSESALVSFRDDIYVRYDAIEKKFS